MDIYAQIAVRIIQGQEAIIGPVAVEQAEQVSNLKIDWPKHEVSISGNGVNALESLIQKYKDLFGHISVEVSKQAAGSLMSQLPAGGLPESLKY
jgi:Iap family predicted aminopeptidase